MRLKRIGLGDEANIFLWNYYLHIKIAVDDELLKNAFSKALQNAGNEHSYRGKS